MNDVLLYVGTIALILAFLWRYHLTQKALQQYKLMCQKAGLIVLQLPSFWRARHLDSQGVKLIKKAQYPEHNAQNAEVSLSNFGNNACVTLLKQDIIQDFKTYLNSRKIPPLNNNTTQSQIHQINEGGLSSIQMGNIVHYVRFLQSIQQDQPWTQSILQLRDIIYFDPALRRNWEEGIQKSTRILPGKNGMDALRMINNVLSTPPSFQNCILMGFPINAILMEFMQTQNGRIFFSHSKINEAFKDILNDYGKMLQSSVSLRYMNTNSPKGWFSVEAYQKVDYDLYDCDPRLPNYGFKCWNDWFLRGFKQGKRPIGAGTPIHINSQNVIVNACESTPLSIPFQPARNVKKTDAFWLKDCKYSLSDMFGKVGQRKGYGSLFEGGTVYQAFLSALYYHHWHSPVDGCIEDIYSIEGTYYLDNSQSLGYFDIEAPVDSQAFLSATAVRMVILIKADNPKIGYVGLIFIGMVEVSSCVSIRSIGDKVKKGDNLGHFMFGGSSHTMLFQKHAKLTFSDDHYESKAGKIVGKIQNIGSYLAHRHD